MEQGRNENEKSVVLMENGVFYGLGFIEKEVNILERERLKEYLTPYPENEMIRSLILRHAEKHPEKIKVYTD
jgi:DNA polymerase-3 subunit epsilon